MVGEGETSYVHVACMQPSQLPCVKSRKLDAHDTPLSRRHYHATRSRRSYRVCEESRKLAAHDTHRCPGTIMQPDRSVHGRRLGLVEPAQEACACPEQVLQ